MIIVINLNTVYVKFVSTKIVNLTLNYKLNERVLRKKKLLYGFNEIYSKFVPNKHTPYLFANKPCCKNFKSLV